MGFDLEKFFQEMFEVLDSDMSSAKKIKRLVAIINHAYKRSDYLR